MRNYAAAYALLANYRPGNMTSYATARVSIGVGATPAIQGALTSATSNEGHKNDHSQYPCRLVRIMGSGKMTAKHGAPAPAASSDGPKDDFSQHPCRLLRIMGSGKTTISTPKTNATCPLSNFTSATSSTHCINPTNATSFPSTPQCAPNTHSLPPTIGVMGSAPNTSSGTLPVSILIHSPKPNKAFSTALFLHDGKYASYNDKESWDAILFQYPEDMAPTSTIQSISGSFIPRPQCEQSEERAFLSTSLLMSVPQSRVHQSYPLVSAHVASSPRSPTQDYSSSTSAYYLYCCQPASNPYRSGSANGTRVQTVVSNTTAGGTLSSHTPSLISPCSDNSSSSSSSLSTLISTPLTNTEDLKEYTALMVSRILRVRNHSKVLASKWLLSMEEEFRTCQEIAGIGRPFANERVRDVAASVTEAATS